MAAHSITNWRSSAAAVIFYDRRSTAEEDSQTSGDSTNFNTVNERLLQSILMYYWHRMAAYWPLFFSIIIAVLGHVITQSMTKVKPQKIGGFADAIRFVIYPIQGIQI